MGTRDTHTHMHMHAHTHTTHTVMKKKQAPNKMNVD